MKKLTLLVLALGLLPVGTLAAQNTANGTLAITATLQSCIYLTLENATGGIALTNASTPAATMALGNVSAYGGTVPTGVTKALVGTPATAFTLSTAFGVKVAQFNAGAGTGYSLTAALQNADTTNTWTVDTKTLSTTAVAVTGGTGYGNIVSHAFILSIPTTEAGGSISNTINLIATQL
jgi:hypothetical protein